MKNLVRASSKFLYGGNSLNERKDTHLIHSSLHNDQLAASLFVFLLGAAGRKRERSNVFQHLQAFSP